MFLANPHVKEFGIGKRQRYQIGQLRLIASFHKQWLVGDKDLAQHRFDIALVELFSLPSELRDDHPRYRPQATSPSSEFIHHVTMFYRHGNCIPCTIG
jgi:hypothetical protein